MSTIARNGLEADREVEECRISREADWEGEEVSRIAGRLIGKSKIVSSGMM